MLKSNINKIILIIMMMYIMICIASNMYYDEILVSKINDGKIIFNIYTNADAPKDTRYIVYLNESLVHFCVIKNKAIAPFNIAHIPYIEKEHIVDPYNMVYIGGFFMNYSYYNKHESIKDGIVFKGSKVYTESGMINFYNIYIGITDKQIEGYPIEIYSIDDIAPDKYIFMIKSKENIEFDDLRGF